MALGESSVVRDGIAVVTVLSGVAAKVGVLDPAADMVYFGEPTLLPFPAEFGAAHGDFSAYPPVTPAQAHRGKIALIRKLSEQVKPRWKQVFISIPTSSK